jgi:hypothetical protein
MATTLYHASPSERRPSILRHGLDLAHAERVFLPDWLKPAAELAARQAGQFDADSDGYYPAGIYLSDSAAAALAHGRWHFDQTDLWRVDMTGLHLSFDRDLEGRPTTRNEHGGRAFFTYDAVPLERLALVERDVLGTWAALEAA